MLISISSETSAEILMVQHALRLFFTYFPHIMDSTRRGLFITGEGAFVWQDHAVESIDKASYDMNAFLENVKAVYQ